MATYTEDDADCFVFTFKEGLLSPIAHDLRIRVARFFIQVDDAKGSVEASFDTASLRVDTPMKDGREAPGALGDADKQTIASQIREKVLQSSRFPEARFVSRSLRKRADGGHDLEGVLTLHGVEKPLRARTEFRGGRQELELTLHQPDFGIAPFRAMMGTLKIRPDVKIRIVA